MDPSDESKLNSEHSQQRAGSNKQKWTSWDERVFWLSWSASTLLMQWFIGVIFPHSFLLSYITILIGFEHMRIDVFPEYHGQLAHLIIYALASFYKSAHFWRSYATFALQVVYADQ